MGIISIMEITEEEQKLIMRHRMNELRKEELDKLFIDLKITLEKIYEKGGYVRLPAIGGKYVRWHIPLVEPSNIECKY